MKKTFLFFLLLLGMIQVKADDQGSCGSVTWQYVESTKTLTLSGNGAMKNYAVGTNYPWSSYIYRM